MRADQVLATPDRADRAAYEDRAARPDGGREDEGAGRGGDRGEERLAVLTLEPLRRGRPARSR